GETGRATRHGQDEDQGRSETDAQRVGRCTVSERDDNLDPRRGDAVGPDGGDAADPVGLPDPHDLAAAYVLDAVDDAERAAFEAHLEGCPDCRREVAELTETSLGLSDGLEVQPPPALREQLLAQVAATPQDTSAA